MLESGSATFHPSEVPRLQSDRRQLRLSRAGEVCALLGWRDGTPGNSLICRMNSLTALFRAPSLNSNWSAIRFVSAARAIVVGLETGAAVWKGNAGLVQTAWAASAGGE